MKRQFASKENSDLLAVHSSHIKCALIVSSDSEFSVELSSTLKGIGVASNYLWSLELLSLQPIGNIDMVVMSSDTWGGHQIYGKVFYEKLKSIPKVLVLTNKAEEESKKNLNSNFYFFDCFNDLEDFIIKVVKEEELVSRR